MIEEAKKHFVSYIETSSLIGTNVDQAFEILVDSIFNKISIGKLEESEILKKKDIFMNIEKEKSQNCC